MKNYLIIISIFVLAFFPLKAEKMTAEKLSEMKKITEVELSPDGRLILFTMNTPCVEKNTSKSDIYMMPALGGEPVRLTYNGKANYNPTWAPDSKRFGFISDRSGKPQAYTLSLEGGEGKQITDMENGVSNLLWSPDGKYLAFTSDVKLEQTIVEKYPDLKEVNARIYDKLPVRHWDEWNDEKYRHLFVVPAEGGEPRDMMPQEKVDTPLKPFGGREQIAWAPNGTEIAYTAKKVDNYATSTNSDIYVVPTLGGKAKNITQELPGFDMDPMYSPDGREIAFHSQARAGFESDRVRLMLYNRQSSRIRDLTDKFGQWVGNTVWASNSQSLYFSSVDTGKAKIFEISAGNGKWKALTGGFFNYGTRALQATKDGKKLIVSRESINNPVELFTLDIASGYMVKQITSINDSLMKGISPAKIEERWITSKDGAKVHCWVVYPPDFDQNKKYPMLTYCQGGPQQAISQYFSYGWSFLTMASEGYIVLAPNRRGCPGFGQDWVDAISQDYGGKPMDDILFATEALSNESYVDKNHIGAVGASAGGYAVFWLEGNHQGRFKAFVAHCGMFDMVSKYGSTEELWFPNWDNGGPYWQPGMKQKYEKNSPHEFVNNWDTPILIITGEKDFRVPYTQSLEAFTAAQSKGIPSRLLIFPNEHHWPVHPQEQLLWYKEYFRFLDSYLK